MQIQATGPTGDLFSITLTKTGDDTATLRVQDWAAGAAQTDPPITDNSYSLDTIRRTPDGASAWTSALFARPEVTVSLSDAPPTVLFTVSHVWVAPNIPPYHISVGQMNDIRSFLAQFPSG